MQEIEASRPQEDKSRAGISHNVRMGPPPGDPPIGKAEVTEKFSVHKEMDTDEEKRQAYETKKLLENPLTALEHARGLKVMQEPTETPDVAPEKVLTIEKPKNAEVGLKEAGAHPVMVYPELSGMVYREMTATRGLQRT